MASRQDLAPSIPSRELTIPSRELSALLASDAEEATVDDGGTVSYWSDVQGMQQLRRMGRKKLAVLSFASLAVVCAAAAMVSWAFTEATGYAQAGFQRVLLSEKLRCHTAVAGEDCHQAVVWAMRHRDVHPEWYIGLDKCADFHDFQSFFHHQVENSGARRCPKPCETDKRTPPKAKECIVDGGDDDEDCHTAVPGDRCYAHAIYTKTNAAKYPKWYPGLSGDSKLVEVQYYLYTERVCPKPCVKKEMEKEDNITGCHTAQPGDTCFEDILLAKDTFIKKHPDWYDGLTKSSSRDEFQAFLHTQKHEGQSAEKKACPLPCNKTANDEFELLAHCQVPKVGEACYESVLWGATKGIVRHPEWYYGLRRNSTFEEFQDHVHKDKGTKCTKPACPCSTPSRGDDCYRTVLWVYHEGLEKHPDRFAGLSQGSSFEAVQQRLHELHTSACGRPCATFDSDKRAPWKSRRWI